MHRARNDVSRLSSSDVLWLQRSIGNQATVHLLNRDRKASGGLQQPPVVQAKLTVGPAKDPYEREADSIADHVVSGLAAPNVQRATRAYAGVPRVGPAGGSVEQEVEGRIRRSNGGSSLPTGVRSKLEPKLGADLSGVKVHTDGGAVQLNRDLGAQAFTYKNHIFYGGGQSPRNLHLTAHEAVHTIQQGAARQVQRSHLLPGHEMGTVQPNISAGNGQANVQRMMSIEERMAKLAQSGMQDPTALAAAQSRKRKSPWNKVRAGLKDIPTLMDPTSKEMTKTKQGATWARRQDKKDQISAPSAYMSKWEITSHLAHFADGGHAFVKPEFHEKIHKAFGKDEQGNLTGFGGWGYDANFIMPLSAAHALTQEAHQAEGILTIEQRLGIESGKDWSWAHPQKNPQKILYRYILKNPGKFGVRMPRGERVRRL